MKIIPISCAGKVRPSAVSEEIADLAFRYWLARCFRNGSPEQDFLQAVLAITVHSGNACAVPRLFLVPKGRPAG